jgi:hypothetical protein
MKTLFQRIDPEVLKSIYDDQEQYPALVGSIIDELKCNVIVSDLSFGAAKNIYSHKHGIFEDLTEHGLYKIFDNGN